MNKVKEIREYLDQLSKMPRGIDSLAVEAQLLIADRLERLIATLSFIGISLAALSLVAFWYGSDIATALKIIAERR